MYCAHCGSYVPQVSFQPCASCGKPTNGAPPRPQGASGGGGTNTAAIVIGVVAGGFALIAVIGILAAIAIPNLITAQQRARQKRTLADMRTLSVTLESYRVDNGIYPQAESMEELQPRLVPRYARALHLKDAWENDLRYRCMDESCNSYGITSSGGDRMFEHVTAAEYEQKATASFDCDIVLVDSKFVQYPEGLAGPGGE